MATRHVQDVERVADTLTDGNARILREATFTGRYRRGPSHARVRIVAFLDYNCPVCREVERQVRVLLHNSHDVSFSPKHYPLCTSCNASHQVSGCRNPSSCLKARIVEAAGRLGGTKAYFAVHERLLRDASDEQLLGEVARGLGVSTERLRATAFDDHTNSAIESDVAEADSLGLVVTPMVFVNGVEVRGAGRDNTLLRTVEELHERRLLRHSAESDAPPRALEKAVDDWALGEPEVIAPDQKAWPIDSTYEGRVFVLWGDLLDEKVAALDVEIRHVVATVPGIRYSFRHCPNSERSMTAARATEAAAIVGGPAGFWSLQRWILEQRETFGDESLRDLLVRLSIDVSEFQRVMQSSTVESRIGADLRSRDGLLGRGTPLLYFDGRWIPRSIVDGEFVLEEIVQAATIVAEG